MQSFLKLLALFTATAFPALAFADLAGLPVPVTVSAEIGLYVYGSAFAALLALRDYARSPQRLALPAPLLMPAEEAFAHAPVAIRRPASRHAFRAPLLR